jgi:anti-sigma B factor antagonist
MPKLASPRVLVESIHGITVARFADAEILTEGVIEEVSDQLRDLVDGRGAADILLNFGEVRLMSSTMLAVLFRFSRRVADARGRLKLCCIAPDLMQAFKITRFDRIFEIHDEESSALDAF